MALERTNGRIRCDDGCEPESELDLGWDWEMMSRGRVGVGVVRTYYFVVSAAAPLPQQRPRAGIPPLLMSPSGPDL